MPNKSLFKFSLLVASVVFFAQFVACGNKSGQGGEPQVKTVHDRVTAAGEIRAAYVVYPPSAIKDPNSGKLSGISVEVIEKAGENLGLKIRWTEEVGWSTMIEGLLTDRYDLVVSGIWPNASRARQVDFSTPIFYSGIGVYVKATDDRFGDLKSINSATVKIATVDGEMSDIIAKGEYPSATRVSLPQLSDVSQLLLHVSQSKADVTFLEPAVAYQFISKNPGSVKNIRVSAPIRVFGNTVMFKRNQVEFKAMLNSTLEELLNSGFVDKVIDRYEPFPGAFYRVAHPYRAADNVAAEPQK
ncbi:MAG: transporter substrate-binding domain-containing protein [Byssovorax sp.]